jgi:hypothetical protein
VIDCLLAGAAGGLVVLVVVVAYAGVASVLDARRRPR